MSRNDLIGITAMFGGNALWMLLWASSAIRRGSASASWSTAEGKVVASGLTMVEGSGRDGAGADRPGPEVRVSYEVGTQSYVCDQIVIGRVIWQQDLQGVVDRYPVGSTVKVYYDPAKPSSSVLEPGTPSEMVAFMLVLGIACLIGAAVAAAYVMNY